MPFSDSHEATNTIKKAMAVVAGSLALIISLALIAHYAIGAYGGRSLQGDPSMSDEAVAQRLKPVGDVAIIDANTPKVLKTGGQVYAAVCSACHAAGVLNAPKFGDKAAWAPHVAGGYGHLVENAIKGIRGMPARGGDPDLSDLEVARAVAHMANAAGADFKPPEVAASAIAGTAATSAAPATRPATEVVALPVTVYFDAGKSGLSADASKALVEAAEYLKADATTRVDISGYTDKTGSAKKNQALAKERANAVRDALQAGGVSSDRINMKKPEVVTGGADSKEARRVVVSATAAAQAAPATSAAIAAAPAQTDAAKGKSIYEATCAVCHGSGVAGAPKFADKAAWAPRIAQGADTLHNHAITGFQGKVGVMPPKGGNVSLSDADVIAAVDYMISQAR